MDDDIDDLLNEVESKYCAKGPAKKAAREPAKSSQNKTASGAGRRRADKYDDLDDIFDDGVPLDMDTKSKGQNQSTSGTPVGGGTKRCFLVYIGGHGDPMGLSTTVNTRACDRLRCTDCDFSIVFFDNYQWSPSVDYLFLRNNTPDFHRLKPMLNSKRGYRAYCCQCKSRSVKSLTELAAEKDLKWFCGKH